MELEMRPCIKMGMGACSITCLGKQTVGCKWVYTVKFNPDGSLKD
jgi:hypothetical protein